MKNYSVPLSLVEWAERNPLFAWRETSGATKAQIAMMVGVHPNTVHQWEVGATNPLGKRLKGEIGGHLKSLAEIMGVPYMQLASAWTKWLNEHPNAARHNAKALEHGNKIIKRITLPRVDEHWQDPATYDPAVARVKAKYARLREDDAKNKNKVVSNNKKV